MNARFVSAVAVASAWFGSSLGCSEGEPRAGAEMVGEVDAEIRNGTVSQPWQANSPDAFARSVIDVGCTGTLVDPSWVLTAKHCGTRVGTAATSRRAGGTGSDQVRHVDAVVHNLDAALDTTMLHLDAPLTDVTPAAPYPLSTADIIGQTVACFGFGAKATSQGCNHLSATNNCAAGDFCSHWDVCMTPSAELRKANLLATAYDSNIFQTAANGLGQTILPGDSGGPCYLNGTIAGVNSFGNVSSGWQASVPASYDFIKSPSRVMYTPGDFNGDGKTDVIVTTPAGSFWHYSTGLGTWNVAYQRTDLPLGYVKFTPGDFNGDGKTDLIISTAWEEDKPGLRGGSYWYYSTGTGTWNANSFSLEGLPMQTTNFTVGNFDGDAGHKDDVIITTPTGSYWYYSTGTGTWASNVYNRDDLPVSVASFTAADFNGDGKSDVIITTPSGSYWYYSTGLGTWDMAYHRDDLPAGSVKFTPAKLNGDNRADVIITTATGSYWYYSSGIGTWAVLDQRPDLPLRSTQFVPADFNGDGRDDLIITTPAGSYWYYSTPSSEWNTTAYQRLDLPINTVHFVPGNFDGDAGHKDDVIITTKTGSYWYYSTGTGTWNTTAYQRLDLPM